MSRVVNLPPTEEANLRKAAKAEGLRAEELARRLIAGLVIHIFQPTVRVSDEFRAMGREALREHAGCRTEDSIALEEFEAVCIKTTQSDETPVCNPAKILAVCKEY